MIEVRITPSEMGKTRDVEHLARNKLQVAGASPSRGAIKIWHDDCTGTMVVQWFDNGEVYKS